MDKQVIGDSILAVLTQAPQWARDDFGSKDPLARERAADALRAMILADIEARTLQNDQEGDQALPN